MTTTTGGMKAFSLILQLILLVVAPSSVAAFAFKLPNFFGAGPKFGETEFLKIGGDSTKAQVRKRWRFCFL